MFWCWLSAAIHTNHFYLLEMIEFKSYSKKYAFWYHSAMWVGIFEKYQKATIFDKTVETK